jgi:hypothetical protein
MNPSRMVLQPTKNASRVETWQVGQWGCCLVHPKESGQGIMRAFVYARVHILTPYTVMTKHVLAKVPPFWQKLSQASAPGITSLGSLAR